MLVFLVFLFKHFHLPRMPPSGRHHWPQSHSPGWAKGPISALFWCSVHAHVCTSSIVFAVLLEVIFPHLFLSVGRVPHEDSDRCKSICHNSVPKAATKFMSCPSFQFPHQICEWQPESRIQSLCSPRKSEAIAPTWTTTWPTNSQDRSKVRQVVCMENTLADSKKPLNQPTNKLNKPQQKNKLSMKITLEQAQHI